MYAPILVITALLAAPLFAQDRKTVYVDKMEGLEAHVEKALKEAELPFDFIEEKSNPELKATLSKMHPEYGEILYKHKFGRSETHHLELIDVATKKVIARHSFQFSRSDADQAKGARDFAEKVKKAYKTKAR
jgi:hypothetical protein